MLIATGTSAAIARVRSQEPVGVSASSERGVAGGASSTAQFLVVSAPARKPTPLLHVCAPKFSASRVRACSPEDPE